MAAESGANLPHSTSPRLALRIVSLRRTESVANEGIADSLAARRSDANDTKPTLPEEPRSRCHKNSVKNFALHRIAAPILKNQSLPYGLVISGLAQSSCR